MSDVYLEEDFVVEKDNDISFGISSHKVDGRNYHLTYDRNFLNFNDTINTIGAFGPILLSDEMAEILSDSIFDAIMHKFREKYEHFSQDNITFIYSSGKDILEEFKNLEHTGLCRNLLIDLSIESNRLMITLSIDWKNSRNSMNRRETMILL